VHGGPSNATAPRPARSHGARPQARRTPHLCPVPNPRRRAGRLPAGKLREKLEEPGCRRPRRGRHREIPHEDVAADDSGPNGCAITTRPVQRSSMGGSSYIWIPIFRYPYLDTQM
jgi:hypothetical protein